MLGIWKNAGIKKIDDQYLVVRRARHGKHYEIRHLHAEDRSNRALMAPGRTVLIGKHRFLLLLAPFHQPDDAVKMQGYLYRYAVDDREMPLFSPVRPAWI
jgi:hypothetical protein